MNNSLKDQSICKPLGDAKHSTIQLGKFYGNGISMESHFL